MPSGRLTSLTPELIAEIARPQGREAASAFSPRQAKPGPGAVPGVRRGHEEGAGGMPDASARCYHERQQEKLDGWSMVARKTLAQALGQRQERAAGVGQDAQGLGGAHREMGMTELDQQFLAGPRGGRRRCLAGLGMSLRIRDARPSGIFKVANSSTG